MNQTVLMHHGIPGQKWGIRRFQRPDGSLTPKGVFKSGKVAYKKENLIRGGD